MNIGIAFGEENIMLEPGHPERVGAPGKPESFFAFKRLYPDELYAWVSPYSPDMSICQKLDVIVYYAGIPDRAFLSVMDNIPCKIITAMVGFNGSYSCVTGDGVKMGHILVTKQIFDKSDFVIVWDRGAVDLLALYTQTPVIHFPLPMPIELALEAGEKPNAVAQFDIVIPHGPCISQIRQRNGIVSALLAQRMVSELGFNRFVMFDMPDGNEEVEKSYKFLRDLGCKDFELLPAVLYSEFIKVLAKARMGLGLDMCRGAGKFAVDCALVKKPAILSNVLPYARDVYKGQESILCDPLDVNRVMRLAAYIADGNWSDENLELAYSRAVDKYSLANAVRVLEEAVYNG